MDLNAIVDQFIDNVTVISRATLTADQPASMKALAQALDNAQRQIDQRMSHLQGQLNAKAFGRG